MLNQRGAKMIWNVTAEISLLELIAMLIPAFLLGAACVNALYAYWNYKDACEACRKIEDNKRLRAEMGITRKHEEEKDRKERLQER